MKKLIELGASIDAAICAADEYDGGYNFERDRKIRDALMALPTVDVAPCDVCRYAPPSSMDGKPCTICPAEGARMDGDNG